MIWPFSTIADLRAELRQAHEAKDVWHRTADRLAIEAHTAYQEADAANAAKMELARQLAEACRERDDAISGRMHWQERAMHWVGVASDRCKTLSAIAAAGAASKNGTARKLARMAREALE